MPEPQSVTTVAAQPESSSIWSRRFRIFWGGWDARLAFILILALVVLGIAGPSIWPESSREVNLALRHKPPAIAAKDSAFWFGTDHLGRDILYRILSASRLTLVIAGLATMLSTVTGTAAGLLAGYFRGWVDAVISRVVDIMLAFPVLLLVLALVAMLGRSLAAVVIVLGLSNWAEFTRVIRSVALTLSGQDFVEAARALGAKPTRILWRHLLVNVTSSLLVMSTLTMARAILTESAVSFLGLGPAPPDVTWGGMVGEGRNYMYEAWWSSLFPGLAIVVTVLSLNFIGDALREAFDPFTVRQARRD